MYRIAHYVSVNELGTAALLAGIAKCSRRHRKIILASSRSVYGEGAYRAQGEDDRIVQPGPRTRAQLTAHRWELVTSDGLALEPIPTPETIHLRPGSVYAATKTSQELLITSASDALGLHSTVFRFQNVYGEGQSLRNPYTGIISIFFNRARQGLSIPLYEDGLESRDFVYISDVVAAMCRILDVDIPSGTAINVGSGVRTSVLMLANTLLRVSGFGVPVEITSQYRVGDIRHCYADLTRLRSLTGISPSVSLEQGLERFCHWAHSQPIYMDRSDATTEELRTTGLSDA